MPTRRSAPTTLTDAPRPALLPAALLVAGALLGAACSSSSEESVPDDIDLAFADDESGDEADAADPDDDPTDPADEVTEAVDTTPTTQGSGLGPVTTDAVPTGGDPQGIYRGVIGTLGPNDAVVAGSGLPPETAPGTEPLTGLPGDVPDRPAAVVKIDNGPKAAPHTGLGSADIVVEEEVEGGVTRFAAVFHSTPSIVGPVRSGRTTDVALLGGLGDPLLLYSGANDITQGILTAQPFIQNRGYGWSSGYWRDDTRQAPSNLYTDTAPHWASAIGGPPPAQFAYRADGDPAAGTAVDEFTVDYPASEARWVWDDDRWLRWQRGAEHLLVDGTQVSAANVVVIEAEEVDTGMVDASGGAVPEFVFVGSGPVTVFTDGKRVEGTWTRPTLTSVATLTSAPGRHIELTPGVTWIQLVEIGSGAVR